MQSTFLLKSIFCILIVNVTLCRSSITTAYCNARCYWFHNGFDYGYYENGQCKCAPPTVYVFDGIGRDFSNEYIETSLNNNNLIENPVTRNQNQYVKPNPSVTTVVKNQNDVNEKLWRQIVETITTKYSFIDEDDLENLKKKIAKDETAMRYLIVYLRKPLENALADMKRIKPYTANECDELLTLLERNNNDDAENFEHSTPKTSLVQGKSIPKRANDKPKVPAKVEQVQSKKWEKPTGNGRKEDAGKNGSARKKTEPIPASTVASENDKSQKIYIEMSDENVNDDGVRAAGKKVKDSVRDSKKPTVKKASAAAEKEHEVNDSGSGSGSWTYEEY